MKFCPNCGTKLNDNGICPGCKFDSRQPTFKMEDVLSKATQKINELAGESGSVKLNIRDLFSEVFRKHTPEESEEIFISGTEKTTPNEKDISTTWPKPWLFSRVFLMFLVTFLALYACYDSFGNINALPGMIFMGAIAVPIALVIFFMEVNAPRNMSFFIIMKIFFVGGGASLVVALLLFSFTDNLSGYAGAVIVGIIEETAKLAIIAYFLNKFRKTKFILTGLLVGAAVGAGFATFETAGYILRYGMAGGSDLMMQVLFLRAFLAPGGHIVWGAILGGALVLAKDSGDNTPFTNKKFISFYCMCVAMHAIWDMPIEIDYYLVQIAMTLCAWIVTLVLIDVGLKEVSKLGCKKNEDEDKPEICEDAQEETEENEETIKEEVQNKEMQNAE